MQKLKLKWNKKIILFVSNAKIKIKMEFAHSCDHGNVIWYSSF